MVDLDAAKSYMRVDYDEDDEFIQLLANNAETYLINAVTNHEAKYNGDERYHKLADTFMLMLITEWYNNRDQMKGDVAGRWGMNYLARSLITQMELMDTPASSD